MSVISMKQLLEAGVHFGHQTRRWNPKMKPYIFTERNGIHIIDLQMTVKKIEEAYYFIRDLAAQDKDILFVGTKKQAAEAIEQEAKRCEQFYVNQRWLGGMLTNFKTIQTRINRLKTIEKMEENGDFDLLPKKEVIAIKAEQEKLIKNLGGIKEMKKLSPSPKPGSWASPSSPPWTPTAILTRWITPSPPTTTPSVRSVSSPPRWLTPFSRASRASR